MRRGQIMNLTEKIFSAEHNRKRNESFENLQVTLSEKPTPMKNEQKEKLSEIMKNVNRDDKVKKTKKEEIESDSLTLDDCCDIVNFISNDEDIKEFIDKAKEELKDGTKSEIIIYALTLLLEDYNEYKYTNK